MRQRNSRIFGRPHATHATYRPTRAPRIQAAHGASPAAIPIAPAQDRIATLDLLRLFAALAVVLFHYGYRGAAGTPSFAVSYPELAPLAKYGFLGVDLFFVISGFVIAASAQGRTAVQFAIARAGRLYPAFFVAMTLTAIVLALSGTVPIASVVARWFANLTMVSPALGQPFMDGAYWSIVLEIIFYGWVALFIALGLFQTRLRTILSVWLAICALNELTLQLKPLRILLLTEYGPMFASGVLIHLIWRGDRSAAARMLLAVSFALGLSHVASVEATFARLYQDGIDVPTLLLLHAGIYLLFWAALACTRYVPATPLVAALGALTYPLYLIHQDAGYILIDAMSPVVGRWDALGVTLILALIVAWLISRYVEPAGRRILMSALSKGILSTQRLAMTSWPKQSRP